MSTIKVSERQVEPALLVSRSCSDGISSDSLMVAGIEVGINSNGFVAKLMEDNNSCLDGKSFNSTAVNGLEVGTNSDGLVVASMEINCISLLGLTSVVMRVSWILVSIVWIKLEVSVVCF